MTTKNLPISPVSHKDVDAMAMNIVAVYASATPAQRADGLSWYHVAHKFAGDVAKIAGCSLEAAAAAIAHTSVNAKWSSNQGMVRNVADMVAAGRPYEGSWEWQEKAYKNLSEDAAVIWASEDAYKIRNFALNIIDAGRGREVTIDRWARAVAEGHQDTRPVPTGKLYDRVAAAYQRAADMIGITPAQCQAVCWVVIRGESF